MSLQANLKAESTTKTLLQRCQDLVKIIDEYPAKVRPTAAKTDVMWDVYLEITTDRHKTGIRHRISVASM